MLHLMVKSSASVEVTLVVWWIVLMIGLLWTWIYAIEVATLYLILASEMTRVCEWFNEDIIVILLSLWEWSSRLLSLHLITEWKEKQLEKISIRCEPGENSEFNRSNEGKTLLNLLSMSTIVLLIFSLW